MRKPTFCSLVLRSAALLALALVSSCALIDPFVAEDADDPDSSASPTEESRVPSADAGPSTEEERPDGSEEPAQSGRIARGDVTEAPPEGGPVRRLGAGQQSAVRVPLARALTSHDAWMEVWAALTANQLHAPERPRVDFSEETVVVLLLGERRTGGYSVEIADVRIDRTPVEVVIRVTRPEPGEMVTQALTSPWYVAAIPVSGRDVRFTGDDVNRGFEGD